MSRAMAYLCAYRHESVNTVQEQKCLTRQYITERLPECDFRDYFYTDNDCRLWPFRRRDAGVALAAAIAHRDHLVVTSANRIATSQKQFVTLARQIASSSFLHVLDLGLDTSTQAGQVALEAMCGLLGTEFGVRSQGHLDRVPIGYIRRQIDGRVHYLPEAAERAWARTFANLEQAGKTHDAIAAAMQESVKLANPAAKADYLNPRTQKPFKAKEVSRYIQAHKHGYPINGESEEQLAARRADALRRNREMAKD